MTLDSEQAIGLESLVLVAWVSTSNPCMDNSLISSGHLAIQFASKMGMEAVVFSTSESKREEAMKFGAAEFHVAKAGQSFDGVEPVNSLLITSNVIPDLKPWVRTILSGQKLTLADMAQSWLHSRRSSH